ncbi:MAG: ATP synthase F1 subunit epsilon, partial [Pseudomonadota bacterium]
MATIHVDIVSAEGEIHSGDASMVFAPAKMGEVGIAPRHAPLLTALVPGEVRVQQEDGSEETIYITGGMLELVAAQRRVGKNGHGVRLHLE